MLETLDTIDWASLEGCYNSGADMPEYIRALLSPVDEIRRWGRDEISIEIYHQGTVYPLTPVVIPFLFELLEADGIPDQVYIACLVAGISYCFADDENCLKSPDEVKWWDEHCRQQGTTFAEVVEQYRALVQTVKELIERRFDLLYPYVRYPHDSSVRLVMAEAISQSPHLVPRLRPDLKSAWEMEDNKYVRGALETLLADS